MVDVPRQLDGEVLDWASKCVGVRPWTLLPGDHEQSDIWIATSLQGVGYVIKCHTHRDQAQREWSVYEFLRSSPHTAFPKPVERWGGDARVLLLEARERGVLAGLTADLCLQLGRALRHLHSKPIGTVDALELRDALIMRWRRLHERFDSPLSAMENTFVESALKRVRSNRVWCHRDFGPHNWFMDSRMNQAWCLDFGQSRPDYFLVDFTHVRVETLNQPNHWNGFQRGYGRALSTTEERGVWALVAFHAVASLAWGQRMDGDQALARGSHYLDVFRRWFRAQERGETCTPSRD